MAARTGGTGDLARPEPVGRIGLEGRPGGVEGLKPLPTVPGGLVNVLVLCAVASVLVAVWVLAGLDGWDYYTTPLRVRGYHHAHALLKPSGPVAHAFGMCGVAMMLVPVAYSVRKKWKYLRRAGSLKIWLEVHIFCGVVGPVLVTFHTAMRFNGIISVAYWSMVLVVLSGFVGRYLYVRIPKSIRGTEMGYDEIVERATELKVRLVGSGLPVSVLHEIDAFEQSVTPRTDALSMRGYVLLHARTARGLRRLRHALRAAGVGSDLLDAVLEVSAERASLLGRLAYLQRTRQWFGAWHVFHQPLVYVMFAIVALHVGVAVYLGYTLFG